jgi:ring-1,2-phenylacetyl-CoA epoxidase subunit PaaD
MTKTTLREEELWDALQEVKDPEIPAVSLVEMGIVREVELKGNEVVVTMTPTFSACPALIEMKTLIKDKMLAMGADSVEVKSVLSPAWTSDWITEAGRRKLKAFGLAPPPQHGGNIVLTFFDPVTCPYCDSQNTSLKNSFGSTLCRMIYYCNDCQDSFEQFKAL